MISFSFRKPPEEDEMKVKALKLTPNPKKLFSKTDWSHSHKGAIFGLVILVVQLILLVSFYQDLDKKEKEKDFDDTVVELVTKGIDMLFNLAAISACIVGFHHLFYYQ